MHGCGGGGGGGGCNDIFLGSIIVVTCMCT